MRASTLLLFAILPACFGEIGKDDDDDDDDDDLDTADTGAPGDTADTSAPVAVAFGVLADATVITTRDTLDFVASATWDDGTTTDVTAETTFASDDEGVLRFYRPGVGQPLRGGTAGWTATWGELPPVTGTVEVLLAAAAEGDLVVNEILADATVDGDPNGDGDVDDVADEFLELANVADATVDLGGVTIVETDFPDRPRHTFAAGTLLMAGEAVVVFGGGSVGALSGDHVAFLVCDNADPDLPYGLSLRNGGEEVRIVAADGTTITTLAYGDADSTGTNDAVEDASLVLSPDVWGTTYTHHRYATGADRDFSPGTFVDGSPFPGPDARYSP